MASASVDLFARPGLRSDQVVTTIVDRIAAGQLKAGALMPPERELATQLGVSRQTLRRALAQLQREGLVERRQGRGTTVVGGRLSEEVDELASFTELGTRRGLTPTSQVLRQDISEADVEDATQFEAAPGTPVLVLHRLRFLDSLPVSIDRSRVLLSALPPLDLLDFRLGSLYAALGRSGHAPVRAGYTVWAVAASASDARLLGLVEGGPLLRTTTVSRDAAGRVVEVGDMCYRGDRYRFRASLTRHR